MNIHNCLQYHCNNFFFFDRRSIVMEHGWKFRTNTRSLLSNYIYRLYSFESTCHTILASFRLRVSVFSCMTQTPCSLCIAIMLYDIVKRYVQYISSGGETSLIWNKDMSVKPIYFVSRTIGVVSSYFNVIFLGRFSTGENTNVRTQARRLRYFCGVRLLAGARYYVPKE